MIKRGIRLDEFLGSQAGVVIIQKKVDIDMALVRRVQRLREQGLSYQKIADLINLWRIDTKSGNGKWYGETTRQAVMELNQARTIVD